MRNHKRVSSVTCDVLARESLHKYILTNYTEYISDKTGSRRTSSQLGEIIYMPCLHKSLLIHTTEGIYKTAEGSPKAVGDFVLKIWHI